MHIPHGWMWVIGGNIFIDRGHERCDNGFTPFDKGFITEVNLPEPRGELRIQLFA